MSKPKLTNDDFCRAAKTLGCEVAAIRAVDDTESRGAGFYSDGFPVILFERHKFRSFTGGRFNDSHPQISGPAGGYGSAGQNQRNKFNLAFKLDPEAAMKSCSWGRYQIMGFNHKLCGFPTVGQFVEAMKESEGRQLDAFVQFVLKTGLGDELRSHDWEGFARGYNGSGFKKNKYDTKMASAYKRFAKEDIDCTDSAAVNITQQSSLETQQGGVSGASNLENPSPSSNGQTVKAEITPEGGVKVETSEGPQAPKERVAVVKAKPQKWTARVWAKITGAVTGNVFFQWIWAQLEKIQGLSIPETVWVIVSVTVAIGSLLWIIYEIVDTWRNNKYQEAIDTLLVKENSTADNLAQLIPADEVELYRIRGYKIITRGETGVPLRALTQAERA